MPVRLFPACPQAQSCKRRDSRKHTTVPEKLQLSQLHFQSCCYLDGPETHHRFNRPYTSIVKAPWVLARSYWENAASQHGKHDYQVVKHHIRLRCQLFPKINCQKWGHPKNCMSFGHSCPLHTEHYPRFGMMDVSYQDQRDQISVWKVLYNSYGAPGTKIMILSDPILICWGLPKWHGRSLTSPNFCPKPLRSGSRHSTYCDVLWHCPILPYQTSVAKFPYLLSPNSNKTLALSPVSRASACCTPSSDMTVRRHLLLGATSTWHQFLSILLSRQPGRGKE